MFGDKYGIHKSDSKLYDKIIGPEAGGGGVMDQEKGRENGVPCQRLECPRIANTIEGCGWEDSAGDPLEATCDNYLPTNHAQGEIGLGPEELEEIEKAARQELSASHDMVGFSMERISIPRAEYVITKLDKSQRNILRLVASERAKDAEIAALTARVAELEAEVKRLTGPGPLEPDELRTLERFYKNATPTMIENLETERLFGRLLTSERVKDKEIKQLQSRNFELEYFKIHHEDRTELIERLVSRVAELEAASKPRNKQCNNGCRHYAVNQPCQRPGGQGDCRQLIIMTEFEEKPTSLGAGGGGVMEKTTGINAAELAKIKARADQATPGPWVVDVDNPDCVAVMDNGVFNYILEVDPGAFSISGRTRESNMRNAEFIAASRTDVLILVAEARRLTARVAELEAEVKRLTGPAPGEGE